MKSSSFSEFYLINKLNCDFLYSQILSLIISPELISIVYGIRFGNVLLLSWAPSLYFWQGRRFCGVLCGPQTFRGSSLQKQDSCWILPLVIVGTLILSYYIYLKYVIHVKPGSCLVYFFFLHLRNICRCKCTC